MGKIEELLEEIKDLQEAHKLLEKIWLELDPYRPDTKEISKETWNKVRDFFKFDDSE
jgi:hypothetical protein